MKSRAFDKALAMELYAKQAKDNQLLKHAHEIKLRAEYRAGEMLREMKRKGLYGKGERKSPSGGDLKTQKELGIDDHEAADWQKLADITPDNFHHAMKEINS